MPPPHPPFVGLPPIAQIGHGGRVRCEPGWQLAPEWAARLSDHDLWCVWAGRGELQTETDRVKLQPGVVVWMRPGGRYSATQDPRARLGVTFVHFTPESPPGWRPPFEVMTTRELGLVEAMSHAVLARRESAPTVAATLLQALLTSLAAEAAAPAPDARSVEPRHHEVVERAAARIDESPAEAGTLAQLAREAGYSPDHFSRLFTRVKGIGPQAYAVRARVERAKLLLKETSLSVSEIAAMLRYSDVYFFSRQFRQMAGIPPTAWRRDAAARRP
jgi:AraC-like DNA-binding protein